MKILCLPDLHLTDSRPKERIDDYTEALKNKFLFIIETAKKNCDLILQPGDFMDSPSVSYDFLCWLIYYIKYCDIPIITTTGQHDLRYRNFENTSLRTLSYSCDNLIILNGDGDMYRRKDHNVTVYASPFNKEVPPIEKTLKKQFNILITHRMIVQEKIWAGQTDAESSNLFLRNNKFGLIISGDNHQSFIQSHKGRYLINCGSMMRSTIAQVDHKPFVVLFDTDKPDNLEIIKIPIAMPKKVFDLQKKGDKKEVDANLDAFCNGLSKSKEMGLVIEDNLLEYYKENKIEKDLIEIIEENMHGIF